MALAVASLWRVERVAAYLDASERTVYRRVRDGSLPAVRVGGLLRFDPNAVAAAVGAEPLPAAEQAVLDALRADLDAREVDAA